MPTKLTEPSKLDIYLIGYPFQIQARTKLSLKEKSNDQKLGDGKGIKTGNDIDKLKESKNQNYKLKKRSKH